MEDTTRQDSVEILSGLHRELHSLAVQVMEARTAAAKRLAAADLVEEAIEQMEMVESEAFDLNYLLPFRHHMQIGELYVTKGDFKKAEPAYQAACMSAFEDIEYARSYAALGGVYNELPNCCYDSIWYYRAACQRYEEHISKLERELACREE